MDPNEIIKAAPEFLKHGAELVGALKLTEIVKTILGPATGEFAERVRDEIRLYRFGRQLELLKKAEKMVQDRPALTNVDFAGRLSIRDSAALVR
jgi:hypothetical protein